MLTDLRHAMRALRAAPGFTLVAAGTLALGIAVNTIAFTLLNSLALRPMPVRDAGRVVRIYPIDAAGHRSNLFSYPDVLSLRQQLQSFDALVAYIPAEVTLAAGAGDAEPQAGLAYAVSANHFPMLGVEPSLGRSFTSDEESSAAAGRVAVISHAVWERRYGASSGAIGNTVVLNGRPFTIVGVGPQRFVGTEPLSPDVWVPLSAQSVLEGHDGFANRSYAWLLVLGRLKDGLSLASAEQEASVVVARLSAAYPAPGRAVRAAVVHGTFFPLDRELTPVVTLVMATISLVLLIACANVASLSFARAAAAGRQIAVRLALGASRWQIVRYQLIESAVVALIGGAAGLLLSAWALRLLYPVGMSLLPESWTGVVLDLTPDVRVFGYTLLLSLAAAVVFGLAPALQTSSPRLASALREDGTVLGTKMSRSSIRDALVVIQLAVCLMLLAAAALTTRSLQRTRSLDLGFHTSGVVYTRLDLRRNGYTPGGAAAFDARLAAQAAATPGVTDVAWTTHVPLTGGVVRAAVRPEGYAEDTTTKYTAVSPSYFDVLDVPIIGGRPFTADEAASGAPIAIVSAALARRFWPDVRYASGDWSPALGRRITTARAASPLTVVGVANDAADAAIWREKELSVYVPATPARVDAPLHLLVRTSGDTRLAVSELRAAARGIDAHLRLEAQPLDDVLRLWAVPARVAAIAAAVLGGLALILSVIGIYGVMSHGVAQRTREIGIRIALGARSQDVVVLMLRSGVRLIAIGVSTGLAGAFATTRLLKALLTGTDPLDPVAFAAATLFLMAAALCACYLPTRRAASVDPIAALRSQ